MNNYCAFSENKLCPKWLDYQHTRQELEDIDELCHGNWIEIQRQQAYIDLLVRILMEHGIEVPAEY